MGESEHLELEQYSLLLTMSSCLRCLSRPPQPHWKSYPERQLNETVFLTEAVSFLCSYMFSMSGG